MTGRLVRMVCLGLLLPALAHAKPTLEVELVPLGARARTAAPFPVELRTHWSGLGILEGQLELEFHDGNQPRGFYRTGPLTLTTGNQTYRLWLPPLMQAGYDPQVEVRLRFITAKERIELEPATLFVPTANERSLVVAWCAAREGVQPGMYPREHSFQLEKYLPAAFESSGRSLVTTLAHVTPADLPAQPLEYCAFDIVVLTEDAFGMMHERQLEALGRWVQAGGSACVFAGKELTPAQADFLKRMQDTDSGGPMFQGDGLAGYYTGLGRCVVVGNEAGRSADVESPAWRQAMTFLWKKRTNQEYRNEARYVPPSNLGGALVNLLLPHTVRLIPFSVLAVLLGLFVLAIGPADYFGLGLFRRRRYTWVLFPVVTTGFTIATVMLANHYLGDHDQRRALIVVDIGKGGAVLRQNRYELIFSARDKLATTDLSDALWAPLEHQAQLEDFNGFRRGTITGPGDEIGAFEGTVPIHYRVRQSLRQWEPVLDRTFSLNPPPPGIVLNWVALDSAVANGDTADEFKGLLAGRQPVADFAVYSNSRGCRPAQPPFIDEWIVRGLCSSSSGLFDWVSAIAPTGGNNFEDAAVWDPSDPREMLVVVIVANGDDLVMYRRLYHGN